MAVYTFSKNSSFTIAFICIQLLCMAQNGLGQREIINLENNVTIEYEKPHIFVKGESININTIAECWDDETDHKEDLCVDLMDALKSKEFEYLSFFALSTVHLRDTIIFPANFGVVFSIVSPEWVVHGKTHIILLGLDGDKVPGVSRKAPRRYNGAPGIPGGPGGTFFGVGENFVSGEELFIVSRGGKGGTGEEGGDGSDGGDGEDAALDYRKLHSEEYCSTLVSYSYMTILGFQKELIKKVRINFWGTDAYFKINGKLGYPGGPGGNGGKGGKGGLPGTVLFLDMGSNSSGVTINYFEGDEGEDGKGGVGGNGGRNGDSIVAKCYYEVSLFMELTTQWSVLNRTENGRASKGKNGIDGGSINGNELHLSIYDFLSSYSLDFKQYMVERELGIGLQPPAPSEINLDLYIDISRFNSQSQIMKPFKGETESFSIYDFVSNSESIGLEQSEIVLEPTIVINWFKSYVRENMRDPSKSESLSLLLKRFESHERIRNSSEVHGFIHELLILEEEFNELGEDDEVDFQPFYRSLRDRIEDYAKKNEVSGESRKVLYYLYTTVLSSESIRKHNSESSLIVNVAEHLDAVKSDMDALKESYTSSNILEIINKYKKQYEVRIEDKIKEAKHLIENLIQPDLDKIGHELDEHINTLITETIEFQKKAEDQKVELMKKKTQLANALKWRGFFSIFQLVGHAMSFLGFSGVSTGLAVASSNSVSNSLASGDSSGVQDLKLPETIMNDLENSKGKTESLLQQKIRCFIGVLKEWNDETRVYPEQLGDTSENIIGMIQKLTVGNLDFNEVRALEDDFQEELDRKEKMLESENGDEQKQKALFTVQRFKKIVALAEGVSNVYKKYKEGTSELEAVEYAIDQAGINFVVLKQYEDKIYNTIIPIVRAIKDIGFTAGQTKSSSRVSLNVADWKVQRFLRDMKKNLVKMTRGFEMTEDLSNSLEELQEVMSTLVNVYDHIQNYQEQQQLANYIADINSVAGNDLGITNPQFVEVVKELERMIQCNTVLQRYKTAIEAFLQFVFPFASLYLHDLVPLTLYEEGVPAEAFRQIENLQSKLKLYNRSVKNPDSYIAKGEFSGAYKSSRPFFVWKNEDHRSVIRDLLSGKEVLVKADISGSPKRMDAVKFNVVALNFRTRNGTLQNRLDESLKHFEVRAVHLGNSYYRYDSKVYLLPTTSHEIEFSYERKKDGLHPVHVGGVYEKIANGDFMLSPYASWKLTLVDITDEADFEELSLFREEVDLELVGRGHYVKNRKIKSLDIDVAKYYKAIDEDEKPLVLDVRAERRKRASV